LAGDRVNLDVFLILSVLVSVLPRVEKVNGGALLEVPLRRQPVENGNLGLQVLAVANHGVFRWPVAVLLQLWDLLLELLVHLRRVEGIILVIPQERIGLEINEP